MVFLVSYSLPLCLHSAYISIKLIAICSFVEILVFSVFFFYKYTMAMRFAVYYTYSTYSTDFILYFSFLQLYSDLIENLISILVFLSNIEQYLNIQCDSSFAVARNRYFQILANSRFINFSSRKKWKKKNNEEIVVRLKFEGETRN